MTLAIPTPSLQERLHQPYQREDWQTVVHGIFPKGTVRLFDRPQLLAAGQESVKSTLQLGTIDLWHRVAPLAQVVLQRGHLAFEFLEKLLGIDHGKVEG